MVIAYDGTDFAGYQRQPNLRTVQGVLEETLALHCKERIHVHAAGRTDAGVHADGQVVHFDTQGRTPSDRYPQALSRLLPRDLSVIQSEEADPGFHARFSATGRIYRYAIYPLSRSPLLRRVAWLPGEAPDWGILQCSAKRLVGRRDFRSFSLTGRPGPTIRDLRSIDIRPHHAGLVVTLEANAFLRGMVRWIIAALWARATGRLEDDELTAMIEARSRPTALIPAPPQGLCLVRVKYAGDVDAGSTERKEY